MSLATIFREFFPILTIFRYSGLIYFDGKETPKTISNFDSKQSTPPPLFSVHFVILLVGLCGLSSITVWVFVFKGKSIEDFQEYVVDKFVLTSIFLGIYIAAFSTIIESFLTWKKNLTFFEHITEIDKFVTSIAPDTNFSKYHKRIYGKIVATFFLIMSIHCVQIYIAITTDEQPEMADFWCTSFVPMLLLALTTCKYLYYTSMVQMRLKIAAVIIEDLVDESEMAEEIIEVKAFKPISLDIADKVSTLRRCILNFFFLISSTLFLISLQLDF